MAPPHSPLAIATSSINRLLKEEKSYAAELETQRKRLGELEAGGEDDGEVANREFRIRQEKQAIEETKAVFAPLRERIASAVEKVEGMLGSGREFEATEVEAARDAVGRGKGG